MGRTAKEERERAIHLLRQLQKEADYAIAELEQGMVPGDSALAMAFAGVMWQYGAAFTVERREGE